MCKEYLLPIVTCRTIIAINVLYYINMKQKLLPFNVKKCEPDTTRE